MLKKTLLFVLLAFPFGMFAQDMKIAYVNTQEIFNAMPEVSQMESTLASENQKYTEELKRMQEEYNNKYTQFMNSADSLPENIKIRRMQEVQDLQQRTETFYEQARQDMAKKQQELQAPIEKKIADAIKTVGDEQGYTYVVQSMVFIYISPTKSIDATPLVRAKLGLK